MYMYTHTYMSAAETALLPLIWSFDANCPTCLRLRRSVFFTDTGMYACSNSQLQGLERNLN